jgi:two-component system, LytTR family, response regulator
MNFILIPFDRGFRMVQAEEIIRVEGLSNYSKIFFVRGNPMTVAKVLHWFEDNLPVQMFARVHRSHLVNKIFVHEITRSKYANLLLTNGESIPISRRKKIFMKAV